MSEHQGVRKAIVWQCLHCKRYSEGEDEEQSQDMAEACAAQCRQVLDRAKIQDRMHVKTVRTEEDTVYLVLSRRISVGDRQKDKRSVVCVCQPLNGGEDARTRELPIHVLWPVT